MEPRQVRTAADALRIVKQRGLSHVKVGVHDVDGVLRGKYVHIDKFKSALEGGMGFCDVVLGWDSYDQLYDNVTFTGWHTAFPDAPVRLLPETCRSVFMQRMMLSAVTGRYSRLTLPHFKITSPSSCGCIKPERWPKIVLQLLESCRPQRAHVCGGPRTAGCH